MALAAEHGIDLIEDACQAHGAGYRTPDGDWKTVGGIGRVGCFSFYPGKNLGALGEGGAVTTNDEDLAAQVGMYRDHGQSTRYVHATAQGVNARMDALKAATLDIKLTRLSAWNEQRRQVASWYQEALSGSGLPLPVEPENTRHVYHLYVVRVPADRRESIQNHLDEFGISTGLHYPIPLHLQPGFSYLKQGPGSFPEAERAANEVLSLPMHPHLTREQVVEIAARLREAV